VDQTIPDSSGDSRYRPLRKFYGRGQNFDTILHSQKVVHWFAENKDVTEYASKLSSLPTGMATPHDIVPDIPAVIRPLTNRTLAVLSSDRVRDGNGQWKKRADVAEMCRNVPWCIQPNQGLFANTGVNHSTFLEVLTSVPFVACVQGGGHDPSPKAWESMYVGTIPIIERSPVSEAYEHYPIAIVDSWPHLFENSTSGMQLLQKWLEELAPFYEEGSALRRRTLDVS
jgi:hypothetical protein